jgi:uncharacterized membrane protein
MSLIYSKTRDRAKAGRDANGSVADAWERAAIGPIPGSFVVVAGVQFHGGWALFAILTLRVEIAALRERQSLIAMG